MSGRRLILAALAVASLGLGLPIASQAQTAGDPPSRVGRLAQVSGTVSFHTSDENQWQAATLNYPVTSGNSFWTEPRSHAAIDVGPSRVYMDSSTELDIGTLNDQGFVASLPQGAVYVRVSDAAGTTPFEIDTPRGQVQISQPGQYEIVAGDANRPTTVTAFDGGAQVTGQGVNLSLGPQQAAAISGQDQFQVATGQAQQPDDFVQYAQGEEQAYQAPAAQAPRQYVSPGMTGAEDLNQYGSWQPTPDYGAVWYPQVDAGWAPYRYGHWAYVAPWGWTWVDDAPWGFAPFHYGRWVYTDAGWGWAPGAYDPYPVYAPALVSFFGDFGGIGIGVSFGDVGWVPLGWGEPYYPGYRVSRHCLEQLNVAYVNNTTIINYNYYNSPRHEDYSHYQNHEHGATMVSADAMQHSRAIGQAWKQALQGGGNQQWSHAKSWGGQAPVKPSYTTAGLTPNTAHQLGINAPAGGFPNRKSPGPSFAGGQFQNNHNGTGNGQPAGGFANAVGGNRTQGQNQTQARGQLFANSHGTGNANGILPPPNGAQTHGQLAGTTHGNQPQFANNQGGAGSNNGLVGHYMKTPPLSGGANGTNATRNQLWTQGNQTQHGNGTGLNRSFASTGGTIGAPGPALQPQNQPGTRNSQNNANQARNYFQQPQQPTNGTRNWQSNASQARNTFQQPLQPGNGTRNWQSSTNQARNYFQQPQQPTNATRNWQSNTNQTRNSFQPPLQGTNGTRNWQANTSQARNFVQPPVQQRTNMGGNWQGNGQTRNFVQPQQQPRTFVTNNAQGWGNGQGWGGGNATRQQVQQRSAQPQAPVLYQKKHTTN